MFIGNLPNPGLLKLVINKAGTLAVHGVFQTDAIDVTITEGMYGPTRTKRVYSTSPWAKDIWQALRLS